MVWKVGLDNHRHFIVLSVFVVCSAIFRLSFWNLIYIRAWPTFKWPTSQRATQMSTVQIFLYRCWLLNTNDLKLKLFHQPHASTFSFQRNRHDQLFTMFGSCYLIKRQLFVIRSLFYSIMFGLFSLRGIFACNLVIPIIKFDFMPSAEHEEILNLKCGRNSWIHDPVMRFP